MLKTIEEIEEWLKLYNIENFTILEDLSVDVHGNVNLYNKKLTHIPIQFGTVNGYFYCSDNSLTSLQGAPREVGGNFYCDNNSLTTFILP